MTGDFIKALRFRLGMSQSEFCACYHIPLSALQNWEQNRRIPEPATQSFLYVIDAMPDRVRTILERRKRTN